VANACEYFEELGEGGLDWIDLAQYRDRYYKTRSFVISNTR